MASKSTATLRSPLKAGVALILASVATSGQSVERDRQLALPRAFFISPAGDDQNDGRSPTTPFRTLEHARDAMRAAKDVKAAVLLPGRYVREKMLELEKDDEGEVWRAQQGGSAIVDGLSTVDTGFLVASRRIMIAGLQLRGFTRNGIVIRDSEDVAITHNVVEQITSSAWSQAAVHVTGSARRITISDNAVRGAGYSGIMYDNNSRSTLDSLRIIHNSVQDTCRRVADCGAIYVDDRARSATSVTIAGNTVKDFGTPSTRGRGIYLDDGLSNALVFCNAISGPGLFAFQIHGGDHNVLLRNVVVLAEIDRLGLYQAIPTAEVGFHMHGNVFTENTIIVPRSQPAPKWDERIGPTDQGLGVSRNRHLVAPLRARRVGKAESAFMAGSRSGDAESCSIPGPRLDTSVRPIACATGRSCERPSSH